MFCLSWFLNCLLACLMLRSGGFEVELDWGHGMAWFGVVWRGMAWHGWRGGSVGRIGR